mgnify:CR=1 FL=1
MVRPAAAQTEIVVQYPIPDIFKDVHEEIAKQFMAANPNIKVKFTQPTKEYEDATQQVLRNARRRFRHLGLNVRTRHDDGRAVHHHRNRLEVLAAVIFQVGVKRGGRDVAAHAA